MSETQVTRGRFCRLCSPTLFSDTLSAGFLSHFQRLEQLCDGEQRQHPAQIVSQST